MVPLTELKSRKTYSPEGEENHPVGYGVQVGAFSSIDNAKKICDKLIKEGKENIFIQVLSHEENKHRVVLYRIIVGDYPDIVASNKELDALKKAGYEITIRKHRAG